MPDERELKLKLLFDNKGALKGVQDLDKAVKKNTDELDKSSKKSEGILSRMKAKWVQVAAGIAGVFIAIKKAFDFTKEFTQFRQASTAMEKQFGVNADKIVKKLKEVSKGTISSANLVLAANRAMALGVTKDVNKMAKLLEFARLRAKAMGTDTTSAFNDIVTGIGRGSPLILDNLGIITKGWAEEAKAADVAYDAQFILNKVLNQATDALASSGEQALTSAEKWQKINAQWSDARVKIGEALLPVLEPLLNLLIKALKQFIALPGPIKAATVAVTVLVPAVIALNAALGPIGLIIAGITTAMGLLAASTKLAKNEFLELSDAQKRMNAERKVTLLETMKSRDLTKDERKEMEKLLPFYKGKIKMLGKERFIRVALKSVNADLAALEKKRREETEKGLPSLETENKVLKEQQELIEALKKADKARYENRLSFMMETLKTLKAGTEDHKLVEEAITDLMRIESDKRKAIAQIEYDERVKDLQNLLSNIQTIESGITETSLNFANNRIANLQFEKQAALDKWETDSSTAQAYYRLLAMEEESRIAAMPADEKAAYDIKKKYAEEKEALEKKYQKEIAMAEHKRTIFEKAANIFRAIIETARAVASALPNVFLSTAVGILGAAQVSSIVAQPIPPVPRFKRGGKLSGYGGGDRVPAILEAGEYIIKKESVSLYGKEFFDRLNAMRFQAGGQVPSNVTTTTTETNDNRQIAITVPSTDPIDFVNRLKRQYGIGVFQ